MSDLITEVDELMKQERMAALWQKYGGFVIGLIVALIIGTAAKEGYQSWAEHRAIAQTDVYLAVMDKPAPTADDLLQAVPDLTGGLQTLTRLQAAGFALKKGDHAEALAIYRGIESDHAAPPITHFIARHIVTRLDSALGADQKRARYTALAQDTDNPWRFHALLDLAVFEAHQMQDYGSAQEHLSAITENADAPESLKTQARTLSLLYAVKAQTSLGKTH